MFVCCTMALTAQDAIRVNYKGAKPTITDFAWAFLFSEDDDEEECDQEATGWVKNALENYRKGLPQDEGVTFNVDEKNGYIYCEYKQDEYMVKVEMCYWNESDQKHKLFAYSSWLFINGRHSMGQYDDIQFYRYNNATKKMFFTRDVGFDVEYSDDYYYSLPQKGKDIIVTHWDKNGGKEERTLKWTGRRFHLM